MDGWIKETEDREGKRGRDYEREREHLTHVQGRLIPNQYINMKNYINRNSQNANSNFLCLKCFVTKRGRVDMDMRMCSKRSNNVI